MGDRHLVSEGFIELPFFQRLAAESKDSSFVSYQDKEKVFQIVRAQLEELLNSRTSDFLAEGEKNICDYGLSDFSYLNLNSETQKKELVLEIEKKILAYIPLICRVKVNLIDNVNFNTLQLLIKAVLVEKSEHQIEFEAVMEPKARTFKINGGYLHA